MCRAADRLPHLCTALHLTPLEFATCLNLPPRRASGLLRPRRAPSRQVVARVLRSFPQVAASWLLTGEGEMFVAAGASNYLAVNYGHNVQVLVQPSSCQCELLREYLREKERTIQLLLTQRLLAL